MLFEKLLGIEKSKQSQRIVYILKYSATHQKYKGRKRFIFAIVAAKRRKFYP